MTSTHRNTHIQTLTQAHHLYLNAQARGFLLLSVLPLRLVYAAIQGLPARPRRKSQECGRRVHANVCVYPGSAAS